MVAVRTVHKTVHIVESLASAINTAEVRGLSTFHGFLYLFFSGDFGIKRIFLPNDPLFACSFCSLSKERAGGEAFGRADTLICPYRNSKSDGTVNLPENNSCKLFAYAHQHVA